MRRRFFPKEKLFAIEALSRQATAFPTRRDSLQVNAFGAGFRLRDDDEIYLGNALVVASIGRPEESDVSETELLECKK